MTSPYPHDPSQPLAPQPPQYGTGYPVQAPVKKSNRTLWIVLGIVAGVVLLCCAGGTILLVAGGKAANKAADKAAHDIATPQALSTNRPAPAATPTATAGATPAATASGPQTFTIGETATLTDTDGSAGTVRISNPVNRTGSLDGKNYVVVTVDITATAGSIAYNPMYFMLKEANGTEHDMGVFGTGDDALQSGDLPAGQKVHGTVAFEAPASALHGSMVEFSDTGMSVIGYWKLP